MDVNTGKQKICFSDGQSPLLKILLHLGLLKVSNLRLIFKAVTHKKRLIFGILVRNKTLTNKPLAISVKIEVPGMSSH